MNYKSGWRSNVHLATTHKRVRAKNTGYVSPLLKKHHSTSVIFLFQCDHQGGIVPCGDAVAERSVLSQSLQELLFVCAIRLKKLVKRDTSGITFGAEDCSTRYRTLLTRSKEKEPEQLPLLFLHNVFDDHVQNLGRYFERDLRRTDCKGNTTWNLVTDELI